MVTVSTTKAMAAQAVPKSHRLLPTCALKRHIASTSSVIVSELFESWLGKMPRMTVVQIHSMTYITMRTHSRTPMALGDGGGRQTRDDGDGVGVENVRVGRMKSRDEEDWVHRG